MGSAYLSYSHLKMKSALLFLALAAVSTASPEDIYKKFLRSMDVYNFRMKCWGEKNVVKLSVGIEMAKKKCMQMVEEEDVPRSKRQVEGLQEFQETNEEFILQYANFQDDLGTMMGNLSCVLKAVPAKVLLNDPTSMVLGHAAVFFKCMNKVERRLCAEAEMLEFLEKVYGPTKSETLEELGLPEDKYAAAGIAAGVLSNAESPEERFVDEFMWKLDDNL